jgi:hypothetical protein
MPVSPEDEARIKHEIRQGIFYKSFMVSGLSGWYLEFGAFRGLSFAQAYHAARQMHEEIAGNAFGARGEGSPKDSKFHEITSQWMAMRFVAFDSFEGIPEPTSATDNVYKVFSQGQYACSESDFKQNVTGWGVNPGQVITVPGFYEQSLTAETATKIGLQSISVAHIDSDLYESAVLALDFCTPYFRDGSIVIFDDWFQFRGNPFLGEQKAFREWRVKNPDWHVSEHQQQGPWSKSFILSQRPAYETVSIKRGAK